MSELLDSVPTLEDVRDLLALVPITYRHHPRCERWVRWLTEKQRELQRRVLVFKPTAPGYWLVGIHGHEKEVKI